MIRVYFVYEDPIDETGVNLSYVDVPISNPGRAFGRVIEAAESGELWKLLYPDDEEPCYKLMTTHMTYLDVTSLPPERGVLTLPGRVRRKTGPSSRHGASK
jgi:hypothetical protein